MITDTAVANLQRIVELDAKGVSSMDETLLSVLAEFVVQAPAILHSLELARQAQETLENVLLHQGEQMTGADYRARSTLDDELSQALDVVGA